MNECGELKLPLKTERQISEKLVDFVAQAVDQNIILLAYVLCVALS